MHILLLGANGRTGRAVCQQAIDAGHTVTSVVRSRSAEEELKRADGNACVRLADPCNARDLAPLIDGHDVVMSVLGPRRPTSNAAAVYAKSGQALASAMDAVGQRPLLVTSTGLAFADTTWSGRLLRRMLRTLVASAHQMETHVRESQQMWTLVRTSFLSDAPSQGMRVFVEAQQPGPFPSAAIARHDVAAFLLDCAVNGRHVREVVGVCGRTS